MQLISCCARSFRALSRAAARAAASRLRELRRQPPEPRWAARAAVCERCPLRVIEHGISYCGQPLLHRLDREQAIHGCGCPTRAKARTPGEHCPIDPHHRRATTSAASCTCKWCVDQSVRAA